MEIFWYCKTWDELSKNELYEILKLRAEVFVVEQNCPYQDIDDKDKSSIHLFAIDDSSACIACLRIVKPGISYREWSIGRVVTSPEIRRTGIGRQLMERGIKKIEQLSNSGNIRISAQCYLEKFYRSLGFEPVGEPYPEDGIPHIEMILQPLQ